ncbi:NUDIX hydrolase [Rhizobium sp.]
MLDQTSRLQHRLQATAAGIPVAQASAICISRSQGGRLQVMLIRSLRTGRWGLPKGGIEFGETSATAAEREAFEEAGVLGSAHGQPIGHYAYRKDHSLNRYQVAVHLLATDRTLDLYPEQGIRERGWFSIAVAVKLVARPELCRMLEDVLENYRSIPGYSEVPSAG